MPSAATVERLCDAPARSTLSQSNILQSNIPQSDMATVHIPTPLRSATGGDATVTVDGATVDEVLHTLVDRYPDLKANLFTEEGSLRQFVNLYAGDDDIRYRNGVDTELDDNEELSIVPSIAGG